MRAEEVFVAPLQGLVCDRDWLNVFFSPRHPVCCPYIIRICLRDLLFMGGRENVPEDVDVKVPGFRKP